MTAKGFFRTSMTWDTVRTVPHVSAFLMRLGGRLPEHKRVMFELVKSAICNASTAERLS